jgi:hypothetical protein
MPRRFKQVRRRLSAFVRVGDCRPRSVKTLVSESAYMGNSALPSGLECGGSLQREVQPLCNCCRSGLELRFEPVQPGLQAAKPWASPQSFPARAVLRSAQSMAEIRKKDRRNGLQWAFCHRRFSVRFQFLRATDRSGRYRWRCFPWRKLLAKQRLIAGDVRRARIRHAGHQHPLHTSQLRVAQGIRCLRKPWSIWSMK